MEGTGGFLSYSGMRRRRHRSGGSAENVFFQFVFEQPRRPCSVECVQLEDLRPYQKTELKNILRCIIILNEEQNTKTIMSDDVNKAFQMYGYNVAQSSELNSLTSTK